MGRKKSSGETATIAATKATRPSKAAHLHTRPAQLPVPTETVSLSSLTLDPANVRQHPERNKQATEASLKRFGAARSIVVDGKGVVRAGNGTVEAARAAGIDKAIVVDADGDQLVVVRRKDWSPSEATAYAIADNRVAEHATWEETGLAEVLRSLQSEDFDLSAVGYTSAEVDSLISGLGSSLLGGDGTEVDDPQGEWKGMPEFEGEDNRPVAQLTVYFASESDKEQFGQLIGQAMTAQTKWVWHPPRESPKGMRYAETEQ
jgi:hypothetical protein